MNCHTAHGVLALRDFGDVSVLCTFNINNIPVATAAGISRSSQLSSSLAVQAVHYIPVRHGKRYGPPIRVQNIAPPPGYRAERRVG